MKCHADIREKFWIYEAEDDSNLVEARLQFVQKKIGGDMSNRLGLYLPSTSGMRLLWGGSVGDVYGGGVADGDLLGSIARLVGVAPEALGGSSEKQLPLEQRVQTALSAGNAFEWGGRLYVPTNASNVGLTQ